ncbi:Aldehyde dehydrogenase, dimeric NADP-preferring [Hypsibius exemplaris]|uniref:Aldehyde dehydrogenase n=1 Tax=Hypsibius exemplaris TaxID=2072580 RepID=A0A1W0X7B2_HYPEX|nr:Aldehyde dehydrogenase, dimeric NADP-preferring [Hypsibius exemplaris]
MRLSAKFSGDPDAGSNARAAAEVVRKLRAAFQTGKSKPYEFRIRQLEGLLRFFDENVDILCAALWKDLHKPRQECIVTEIEIVKNEIRSALASLKKWMAPRPAEKSLAIMTDYPFIQHEPYGVALIIGAWNYPVNLLLSPLVGAISAGNCVLIKPSEVSENVERLLEQLLPQYLDKNCFEVVCAGPEDTSLLLKEQFDYIFFTGSTTVGKIVYEAAAKHLTPVTLEMGGKSPVYVDADADMALTAKRIMWGKTLNAGQTCIAPDYVLCTADTQRQLVEAMKKVSHDFSTDQQDSKDYCHIVSDRQFNRLKGLLKDQTIGFGGQTDAETRYIAPTVLTNVDPASDVMKAEIFGPILPIIPVADVDQAIRFVQQREKPLALYIFAKSKKVIEKILRGTTSGGACVNDTIMHVTVDSLPFGGVGPSGLGAYHGFSSFETFSHKRSILWKPHGLDFLYYSRYPPYSEGKTKGLIALLKYRRPLPSWLSTVFIFGLGGLVGYAARFLNNHFPIPAFLQQHAERLGFPSSR